MMSMNNIKPDYYKAGEMDVIAFCQYHDIPFDLGNVIKYVTRAGKKYPEKELQKHVQYSCIKGHFSSSSGCKF